MRDRDEAREGGRTGNDFLQQGGRGYQSWAAEGPSGVSAGATMNTGARGQAGAREEWVVGAHDVATPRPRVSADSGRSRVGTLLVGMSIGAALMYFLDPDRGNRRRRIAVDRALSAARGAGTTARDVTVDARNRALGTVAEVRGRLSEGAVSDDVLVARVRAELGHEVDRVRPIEVVADGGAVTLRGSIAESELPRVLATAERVRGVQRVVNELEVKREGGEANLL